MRCYFIHKEACKRNDVPFPFPPLTKRWVFTSCNTFIVIPSLSPVEKKVSDIRSASAPVTASIDPDATAFHRLSLNLGTLEPLMPAFSDLLRSAESTTLVGEGTSNNMDSEKLEPPVFPYVNEQGRWRNIDDFRSKCGSDREPDYKKYPDLTPLLSLESTSPNDSIKTAFRVTEGGDCKSESPGSAHHDAETSSFYSQDGDKSVLAAATSKPLHLHLSSHEGLATASETPRPVPERTGNAVADEKFPAHQLLATPSPSSSSCVGDKILGSPSSPSAPAASPLATKSALHSMSDSTGRRKFSSHSRTRHEPLTGPNSPVLDMSLPKNTSVDDESLKVAPLRLTERKLKRRSSISEGQIAQLRAQLQGKIRVPPEDDIFTGEPQPAGLLHSAARIDPKAPNVSHTPCSSIVFSDFAKGRARAAELPPAFPGFERRFTPIAKAVTKSQLSPRKQSAYGSSDLPFPRLGKTWSSEQVSDDKVGKHSLYDQPPPHFTQPARGDSSYSTGGERSAFSLDKGRSSGQTVLPRLGGSSKVMLPTKEPVFSASLPSPNPSGRPKHRPIVVKEYEQPALEQSPALASVPAGELRQGTRDAVPQPQTTAGKGGHKSSKSEGSRSASTAIADFFSWRKRKGSKPNVKNTRPPSTAWNPFERAFPEPPSSSEWVTGEAENDVEKNQRATFFKAKVSEEAAMSPSSKTADRGTYAVETLPRARDRSRSRPRVTAESFASSLQHKFSRETFTSRRTESTDRLPPLPPLPSTYRSVRPANTERDLSHDPPTNALEAASSAAAMASQGRARRFASQDQAYTASESSLRGIFLRSGKKSGPKTDQK